MPSGCGHFFGVDGDAEFFGFVGHVEQHHHVQVELLELQQQAHLALDLRGVEYDQCKIGHVVVQEVAHHLFVVGKTVQVVDAGQVDDFHHVAAEQDLAAEQFDGNARPVADARRAAGHAVEQGGLAGIGHAQQCDAFHALHHDFFGFNFAQQDVGGADANLQGAGEIALCVSAQSACRYENPSQADAGAVLHRCGWRRWWRLRRDSCWIAS